jgi:hypothetical protein
MFFFPAVVIAAYYGGFGPELLTTLLSAVIAHYVFIGPRPLSPQGASAPRRFTGALRADRGDHQRLE